MMKKIKAAGSFILRHWFGILCLAFILFMCFGGEYSVKNIISMRAQETALRKEIEEYKDSINNFERRIDEVSVDSKQLERHARERMHMHRENEDLYIIEN
jgi:cell division protein FtsB